MNDTMKRRSPDASKECVWDYPRPPRLEPSSRHLKVVFAGQLIAETGRAYRVLETSHPPVYYFPPEDIRMEFLVTVQGWSFCEWKGRASYYEVKVGERAAAQAAWYYSTTTPSFAPIRGYIAFYAGSMDACTVDGEVVVPQPGGFYGGWITSDLIGPFKGEPGSWAW
jgi:uncharacterized protein (DUF427 family)